jgi:hypothetical protein
MKINSFICVITILAVIVGCSEAESNSDNSDNSNFYALTVGNSWTYEFFRRVSDTDEFESIGVTEVVKIIDEVQIDGEIYYTIESTTTGNDNNYFPCNENGVELSRVRDSLGYLINGDGKILFSKLNTDIYLIESNANSPSVYGQMIDSLNNVSVAAGEFVCLPNRQFAINPSNSQEFPGNDYKFRADGVGEILRYYSFAFQTTHSWEKRLTSYSLQE